MRDTLDAVSRQRSHMARVSAESARLLRAAAPDGVLLTTTSDAGGVLTAKLQKRAFSAFKRRHWIIMRAERAGATRTHARSALRL